MADRLARTNGLWHIVAGVNGELGRTICGQRLTDDWIVTVRQVVPETICRQCEEAAKRAALHLDCPLCPRTGSATHFRRVDGVWLCNPCAQAVWKRRREDDTDTAIRDLRRAMAALTSVTQAIDWEPRGQLPGKAWRLALQQRRKRGAQ